MHLQLYLVLVRRVRLDSYELDRKVEGEQSTAFSAFVVRYVGSTFRARTHQRLDS